MEAPASATAALAPRGGLAWPVPGIGSLARAFVEFLRRVATLADARDEGETSGRKGGGRARLDAATGYISSNGAEMRPVKTTRTRTRPVKTLGRSAPVRHGNPLR